jgi:hypothetical protein
VSSAARECRRFRQHDLDRIEIRSDVRLPFHADGEDRGDVEQAVFEAERDAVVMLVPLDLTRGAAHAPAARQ